MYAKLFASLYQGTLRGCADEILVFTNLLAHADSAGVVDKHWRAIAEECGISRDRVEAAIARLEAPDPESRSPEEEGRRLIRIDEHRVWGWRIVNHGKYRAIRNEDDRRSQNREAQERWREKHKQNKPRKPVSAQAEAEAEAEAEVITTGRIERGGANAPRANEGEKLGQRGTRLAADWQPSADERGFAADLGIDPDATADAFRDYWVAVPGAKGRKLDWPATWRGWCRRETARPVGKGAVGRLQPTRGNDAFYQQLAHIARRTDD